MTVAAIIQARMGSKRLPGKVLLDLGGKTVLQRVLERATKIRGVDRVIVAIHSDRELYNKVREWGYEACIVNPSTYDENDVLSRYVDVASHFGNEFDTIVRITADCPLLDPEVSSRVLDRFQSGFYGYYSNVHPPTYPDGLDTEVFTLEALEEAYANARGKDREHVTSYIWSRPKDFDLGNLAYAKDLSKHRWTLDTETDYEFLKWVYRYGTDLSMDQVLALPFALTLQREIKL